MYIIYGYNWYIIVNFLIIFISFYLINILIFFGSGVKLNFC